MSRFGFKFKKCEEPFGYAFNMDCIGKVYIDSQSVVFWRSKSSSQGVWMFNLTKDQWYKLSYDTLEKWVK